MTLCCRWADGSGIGKVMKTSNGFGSAHDWTPTIDSLQRLKPTSVPRLTKRSEERRVGKECRSRWSAEHYKKKGGNSTLNNDSEIKHEKTVHTAARETIDDTYEL